jgi:transposase
LLFRGKRGDLLKTLWRDGQGLMLLAKRLGKGRFIWPTIARQGVVTLTPAQLAMLLESLDWRTLTSSWKPEIAVYPLAATRRHLGRFRP